VIRRGAGEVSKRCLGPRPLPPPFSLSPSVSQIPSYSPHLLPPPLLLLPLLSHLSFSVDFLNFYIWWLDTLTSIPFVSTRFIASRNDQTPQRTLVVDTPTKPVRTYPGDNTTVYALSRYSTSIWLLPPPEQPTRRLRRLQPQRRNTSANFAIAHSVEVNIAVVMNAPVSSR
jgi:hypothetical protein